MKKKVLGLIVAILLFIPLFVKADMGAPMLSEYEVIVNKEGAAYYSSTWKDDNYILEKVGTLDYNTTLKIVNEDYDEINGEYYYEFTLNNGYYFINRKNVVPKKFDFDTWKNNNSKTKQKFVVIEEGTYLYNGPAVAYGKNETVGELKVGTVLEGTYSDERFAYVDYNGTKGFVYTFTYAGFAPYYDQFVKPVVSIYDSNLNLYIAKEIKLEDYQSKKESVIKSDSSLLKYTGTVPANTKVKVKYHANINPHDTYVYIEYNGISGWYNIIDSDVAYVLKYDVYYKNTGEIKLYSELKNGGEVVATVKPNTKVKVLYIFDYEWNNPQVNMYVDYNGTKGWYYIDYGDNMGDEVLSTYSFVDGENNEINHFDIYTYGFDTRLVTNNNSSNSNISEPTPDLSSEISKEEDEPDQIVVKKPKKAFNLSLVIILVAGATLLLVTVVVIVVIILIVTMSKKKKNNVPKNNVVTENSIPQVTKNTNEPVLEEQTTEKETPEEKNSEE